jgi:hypothetical protein
MRYLPVLIVVLALACAATAEAKTLTLKGSIKGDSNSKIALKLDIDPTHNTPKAVIKFTYSGIDTYQAPEPGQIGDPCSIGEQKGKLPPAVPSVYPGQQPGTYTFNAVDPNGGEAIQARGALSPYPVVKKAVGYMTFLQPDHTVCASKDFKLKKT